MLSEFESQIINLRYENFEPFTEENNTSLAQKPSDSINHCLSSSWSSCFWSFCFFSSFNTRVARARGICITALDIPLPNDHKPALMISSWLSPCHSDQRKRPRKVEHNLMFVLYLQKTKVHASVSPSWA